jgi:hypothetical protein
LEPSLSELVRFQQLFLFEYWNEDCLVSSFVRDEAGDRETLAVR